MATESQDKTALQVSKKYLAGCASYLINIRKRISADRKVWKTGMEIPPLISAAG